MTSPSLTRHRKTFFAPLWLFGALAALVAAVGIGAWLYARTLGTTTLIVVRHAEKQLGTIADPPLAPAGELRAERLAAMLGEREAFGRVQVIYVTSKRRSQQTAAPVARRLGLTPVVADDPPEVLAHRLLREHRGRTLLVVGHSNTVPELIRRITGTSDGPEMSEADEYDTMYWVSVPAFGASSVVRIKY